MTSNHSESGKYSFLWALPDAELERLLQMEYAAADDRAPDEDYIMAIVEVIESRETESPAEREAAKAALDRFRENYMGQSDAYECVPLPETNSSTIRQTEAVPRKKRVPRIARAVLIAAILCCVLGGIASAAGWLDAILTWTSETFGFAALKDPQGPEAVSDDVYAELRDFVAIYTDLDVVPHWAPEGTQMENDIRIRDEHEKVIINCTYQYNDKLFLITFRIYENKPVKYPTKYEKSEQAFSHAHDGIEYYITDNNSKCTAIWYLDNVEGVIQGDLSYEDLIEMVDSI